MVRLLTHPAIKLRTQQRSKTPPTIAKTKTGKDRQLLTRLHQRSCFLIDKPKTTELVKQYSLCCTYGPAWVVNSMPGCGAPSCYDGECRNRILCCRKRGHETAAKPKPTPLPWSRVSFTTWLTFIVFCAVPLFCGSLALQPCKG